MIVLGIRGGGIGTFTHDSGAAIIRDGKTVAAVAEERFSRVKHDGIFPFQAINYVIREAGLETLDEIDAIAIPNLPPLKARVYSGLSYVRTIVRNPLYTWAMVKQAFRDDSYWRKYRNDLRSYIKELRCSGGRAHFVEHHLAHAASAYYTSGFSRALTITMDWRGEHVTSTINIGEGGAIERKCKTWWPDSPGYFFATITRLLGFRARDQEWKVMGLAAYGNRKTCYNIIKKAISLTSDGLRFKSNLNFYAGRRRYALKKVLKRIGLIRRDPPEPVPIALKHYKKEDVAAAAQLRLEELVIKLVTKALEVYGGDNAAMAGGVAMNVKMNRLIREQIGVNLFVHPNAGDGGTPLGAALQVYKELAGKVDGKRMEHVFLGPSYSDDEILTELNKHPSLKYECYDDIAGMAGELLAKDNNIVGWFQGRAEWGPRALGARSCLADPRDPRIREKINSTIKRREPFLPYCPTILDRAAKEYLERCDPSQPTAPFMIDVWDATDSMKKDSPGVIHVDGTVRAQVLKRNITQENQLYYRLIEAFEEETGIPIVLNTSLNLHGKPIVNSPKHVIEECLPYLDYLAVGHYLVEGGLRRKK